MITRLVKLQLREEHCAEFIAFFPTLQPIILNSEGCLEVNLFREHPDENVFFTISKWTNEDALNNYRHSAFFNETWATVKTWFDAKAEAWTLNAV